VPRCPGPAKVCAHACLANDWTMSVSVGIITAQMLQDAHLTDIGAQGKQSTPSGAVDVEICLNALSTPRGSKQQSAGASDPIWPKNWCFVHLVLANLAKVTFIQLLTADFGARSRLISENSQ